MRALLFLPEKSSSDRLAWPRPLQAGVCLARGGGPAAEEEAPCQPAALAAVLPSDF